MTDSPRKPFVVGVTGGIGSGKTAVTDYLSSKGIQIVDADLASRVIVEPGKPALAEIADHFGPEILQPDGTLDRRQLRHIVFNDEKERRWLEALTHPLIAEEILSQIARSQSPYTVLVSPLLFESGQSTLIDRALVIDVPEDIQIMRTAKRDEISEELARQIIAAQLPREKRLAFADDIICNDKDLPSLYQQLEPLHKKYLELAQTAS